MPRTRKGAASRQQRNRILKQAKGYYGGRSRNLRIAKQAVTRSARFATRDRATRKRNFRSLWIVRVNAALEQHAMAYNQLIAGMRKAGIEINRKILADMAINDAPAFEAIVNAAKAALASPAAKVASASTGA